MPRLRRHRVAVAGVFFVVGVLLGTWFARVPELRTALHLDFAELGAVLLAQTVGVIVAMQVAGHLSAYLSSRTVIRLTAAVVPWFPALVAISPGAVAAAAAMLVWGLVAGLLDVAMNAQGVELERAGRRPFLSSLHAVWGAGALTGSLGAVAAIRAGVPLGVHFIAVAAVLCVLALVAGRHALPERQAAARREPGKRARTGLLSGWTRAVVVLGGLGAAAALCEGAVSSWCGVFLREQRGASADVASLGYFVFVLAQTGTRMFGDRGHRLLGPVALLRWSMAATAAGVLVAVLSPDPWWGLAGFALQGCGLAVVIPLIAGAVGHGVGGNTSLAIARYSTLHQAGVLAGPALFGRLAQTFGVSTALALLVLPLGLIAAFATATARARPDLPATERRAA
ncbi:major facilitator transporter [Amycolatopsis mediterranei S699]|uniref:Major facilitator transporter n=2 Tax=Amycolatopsis mediterranei TaxID=33910 RepID=A0A0H3DHH9_AMYMU|nr:MFS transporter [Amycolatopsis mediterranei]ADJ49657.1 major facilitator transporter [Amycolatopsis mediterranei U32]AEK46641.1 major facilitator transporter [Amycolatopsis mediterranei S699]AFO81367.1 major facilitator transporter [Amycolatopsis mediterranei S699]AGT88495.1 major facilitator transporter [Amycolatopsis mediterranei RB]KDO08094.1 MFS transporter [Amycolatopsis mediterranei]